MVLKCNPSPFIIQSAGAITPQITRARLATSILTHSLGSRPDLNGVEVIADRMNPMQAFHDRTCCAVNLIQMNDVFCKAKITAVFRESLDCAKLALTPKAKIKNK